MLLRTMQNQLPKENYIDPQADTQCALKSKAHNVVKVITLLFQRVMFENESCRCVFAKSGFSYKNAGRLDEMKHFEN